MRNPADSQPATPGRPTRPMSVRVFSALSLLTIVGTIGAAQFDFVRRHYPGITPQRYWLPQVMQVWLPGLGVALALGVVAFVLERRARGQ